MQLAALEKGAARAKRSGKAGDAGFFSAKAKELRKALDGFWDPGLGFYRSRMLGADVESPKALDFSVILGVLHAGLDKGPHSVQDERVLLTFKKLHELFAAEYAINSGGGHGIMFGRYKGDSYVSGGAYYFSTFGAAEFYYRAAEATPSHRDSPDRKGRRRPHPRPRFHPGIGRPLGAIRPDDGRADLRQGPFLELRLFHHRMARAPGGPGPRGLM